MGLILFRKDENRGKNAQGWLLLDKRERSGYINYTKKCICVQKVKRFSMFRSDEEKTSKRVDGLYNG